MANLGAPFVLMYKVTGVSLKHMLKGTFKPYGSHVRSVILKQGQEIPSNRIDIMSIGIN